MSRATATESVRIYMKLVGQALRHPGMVRDLLGMAWAARARDWYRRPPFIPLPPRSYMRWRMDTAYGDPDAVAPPEELRRYLRWAREMRQRM